MEIDIVEYSTLQDFLFRIATLALLKGNGTEEICSYKGRLFALYSSTDQGLVFHYTKGTLNTGVYKYEPKERKVVAVPEIATLDQQYFIVYNPKVHSVIDRALEQKIGQ